MLTFSPRSSGFVLFIVINFRVPPGLHCSSSQRRNAVSEDDDDDDDGLSVFIGQISKVCFFACVAFHNIFPFCEWIFFFFCCPSRFCFTAAVQNFGGKRENISTSLSVGYSSGAAAPEARFVDFADTFFNRLEKLLKH